MKGQKIESVKLLTKKYSDMLHLILKLNWNFKKFSTLLKPIRKLNYYYKHKDNLNYPIFLLKHILVIKTIENFSNSFEINYLFKNIFVTNNIVLEEDPCLKICTDETNCGRVRQCKKGEENNLKCSGPPTPSPTTESDRPRRCPYIFDSSPHCYILTRRGKILCY